MRAAVCYQREDDGNCCRGYGNYGYSGKVDRDYIGDNELAAFGILKLREDEYGGSSKSGVDCSGFVMQIYKEVRGMSLPHKASKMYDMGKSVSRDDLEEGDLVFFGSFWEIDHVGIYLSGNRFVHASSSKGVMISPMDNVYWKKRYQGARRY